MPTKHLAPSPASCNVRPVQSPTITIAYLYTTFPKDTETFMQREVLAMRDHGVNLRVYSLFGGGGDFHGLSVRKFSMWRLL